MRKLLFILMFICLPVIVSAQENNYQQNLKLGNTYLNAGDYLNAEKFITMGYQVAQKENDPYWIAVAYEYYAYLYDMRADQAKAKLYFKKALEIYDDIITQPDGSPIAVRKVLKQKNKAKVADFYAAYNETTNPNKPYNFDNQKIKNLISQLPKNPANLSLANCRIKDIYFLLDYNNLQFLNLSNNKIKKLPHNIDALKNLVYLDLSNNGLKEISTDEFIKFKNLKVLNLNNKLEFENISNLIRLLPNTNILHDEYEKKEEDEDGFGIN